MQQERQQPPLTQPPAYTQHDPNNLHLPSVPTHSLPPLRSLDLPDAHHEVSPKTTAHNEVQQQWGHLPPLNSATFPRVPEGDLGSPMDTSSVVSGEDRREMSVLSVDDPDVRLAAEALSGLGNLDFARSPTTRSITLSTRSPPTTSRNTTAEPEPLLNLLTSAHPWLGGSINGSISAYTTTKHYSPRFVKYGAELIERNIGSPVVNTVSSVGRRTGVEKNLRRYLGDVHRRPSDLEQGVDEGGRKRQRIMSPGRDAMEIEEGTVEGQRTRGGSQSSYAESLPAYDDHRSPKYEETAVVVDPVTGKEEQQSSTSQDRRVNWSTQLIMTTSGLGAALSDASLKSLKTCLGLLRSATKHIDSVMHALKLVLEEYETALRNNRQSNGEAHYPNEKAVDVSMSGADSERDEQVRRIADRMKSLSSDIWTTLQNVVQSVSRYTGGRLPQNASQVVRTQLLSVPQRWQLATRSAASSEEGAGEEVRGANRMLAFAKEGLDMMGQITTVVDGTVQSAETWLARIGRRPQQNGEASSAESEKAPLVEVRVEKA